MKGFTHETIIAAFGSFSIGIYKYNKPKGSSPLGLLFIS